MNFQTSVRTCLSKYATFSGRAIRSEYWWFVLFVFVGQFLLGIVDFLIFGAGEMTRGPGYFSLAVNDGPLSGIFMLAMLLPALAAGARRLHDTGRSGWWLLLSFIPVIGTIVLIVFLAQRGEAGTNAYGPLPGAAEGGTTIPRVSRQ